MDEVNKSATRVVISTALTCVALTVLDVLIYGELFPLLGLYLGNKISARFEFPLVVELFLVIGASFLLFFLALALRLERNFWQKLYSLEHIYTGILYVRDTINLALLGIFVASLVSTLLTARTPPSGATKSTVLEYPLAAFADVACNRLGTFHLSKFVSRCSKVAAKAKYEVSFEANILYAAAYLAAAISKMLYFNTLFTYLQTLKMFREIQTRSAERRHEEMPAQHVVRRRRQQRPQPAPDNDNTILADAAPDQDGAQ